MPGPQVHEGMVHRIEVENFKSYKGRQVIGPFMNFTAVVGPNGAGKSNLMDAISFVLGVRSAHLRGSQLKDLIYALDDDDRDDPNRGAHVMLVYIKSSQPASTYSGMEELQFTRAITSSGSSQYRINGSVVSWDDYNSRLKDIGILVKARNFLVFQGDVESIASKSPKELTGLFEQIAGSDELRKEYEAREADKSRAEERTMFAYQKKKNMSSEKKHKKEQKEEAERHLKLQQNLKDKRAEFYLWQLYCIEKEMNAARSALAASREELQRVQEEQGDVEKRQREKMRERAVHSKDVLTAEKKVARKAAEIDKKRPEMVKVKEEMRRAEQRLKEDVEKLEKLQALQARQQEEVARLERSLEDVQGELADMEGMSQAGGQQQLHLAQSQLEEYHKRKEEAGSKTFRLRQEKEALDRQQHSDVEAQRSMEASVAQMAGREEQLGVHLEQARARVERVGKDLAEGREALERLRKEETEMRDRHRRARHRAEALEQRLEEAEAQLRELKADRRENERETRMAETVATMKRLFPGVHGRLSDLCKPTQRRFNMAVTVVMGKLFDAVAVEDERTAKECIEYLRAQRLPPMTFIPLQTARVKAVNERLRSLGGTCKLVLDVIQYPPHRTLSALFLFLLPPHSSGAALVLPTATPLEVAMVYAVGNTLVCDTLDEARSVAWGAERHKVVALDGTLLAKNGCMTGGTSGGMETRSQRWDEQEVEKLKAARDKVAKELSEVLSVRETQSKEQEIAARIAGLERKTQYAEMELKMSEEKVAKAEQELAVMVAEKDRIAPEITRLTAAVEARLEQVGAKEQRINEIMDRVFREFSRTVGVANIREYEENQLQQAQQLAERRLALANQIAKLSNQLEYERRRDSKGPVEALQASMEQQRQHLEELTHTGRRLQAALEKARDELQALKVPVEEAKAQAEAVEAEVQALSKAASALTAKLGKAKRSITAKEAMVVQLHARRGEVLERCEMEQVPVRTAAGALVPSVPLTDTQATGAAGGSSQAGSSSAVGSGGGAAADFSAGVDEPLDFSTLPSSLKKAMTGEERERKEAELRKEMEEVAGELERTAPNLKALEQFEALRAKEREMSEEFESIRREAKEAVNAFNHVHQQRYERFMAAFAHVSTCINRIYKDLTSSSAHPLGGTAYLSLENEDEPFLHGIKYTAMPPSKRFRDMEQLSGGEKTVAALALLFAIHSYRPSPLFVLDEVDAALDNLNVAKVAAYIRAKSRHTAHASDQQAPDGGAAADASQRLADGAGGAGGEAGFQSIVISLKDQFYSWADGLIGVVRDSEDR
ncbi:unnamed protein product [Closterium sp. Naga37s-1]|nr:unnamed protein product [Closterium sp. Naga37s-1]